MNIFLKYNNLKKHINKQNELKEKRDFPDIKRIFNLKTCCKTSVQIIS